jgi:RND family efflux transporter MFP subunit
MAMKTLALASLGLLSLLGGAAIVPRQQASAPTAVVREGSFSERLVETGSVSSGRLLLYGSSITGVQSKIVDLVPEGRTVAAGDVLIRFDSAGFEQNLAREEAGLRQAEAELFRAREELRIERLRAEGDVTQARQQVGSAQSELANQTSGKGKVVVAEMEAAEAEAEREAGRARTIYEDMKPMLARGFITRTELERSEQALRRAEEQLRLATLRREATIGFERPAASARSQAEVDAALQALNRQQETVKARLAEREASIRIASSRVDEIKARMSLLQEQLARCVVTSEAAGMVVYRDLFFGNDKRKPQVGDEVWSGQPIIALPDFDQLTIETRIREIDLHHLQPGGSVSVTLPAYPDLRLDGTIALIGTLAEVDPTRAGTKFFPVTVTLSDPDRRLRTGMSAQVEIQVAALERATLVPTEAVFEAGNRTVVYVVERGGIRDRDVQVIAQNDRDAAVKDGVSPGDVILLKRP